MTSWRAELVERVARRLCQLDRADPEAWAGYLDDANAAADILIPAILERAAAVADDAIHASDDYCPMREEILSAIRSLKDNPDVEA